MNTETDFDLLISPPEVMRYSFSSAKKWATYAKEYYNLDWHEQYEIRYQELKAEWKAYKEKRLKSCFRRDILIKEDAESGDCKHKFSRCGEADCPFCGPYQVNLIKTGLAHALDTNGGELRKVVLASNEERAKLVRKYGGKDKVAATPIELDNGKVIFEVLVATNDKIGTPYTRDDLDKDDMVRWTKTMYGYNKSGELHNLPKKPKVASGNDEPIEDEIEVPTQSWTVDFSKCNERTGLGLTHDAWAEVVIKKSIQDTIDLRPSDLPTLKQALKERRQAREDAIKAIGGVIFDVEYRKNRVRLSHIDWSVSAMRVQDWQGDVYFAQIRQAVPS